eukprot:GHVS01079352.1.p1 GENE.GHVS01079352.1~~GHVS01079352.1.p1  ORF type:complete len:114 (+),score=2.83 GHVS01079352.1:348-689(+)
MASVGTEKSSGDISNGHESSGASFVPKGGKLQLLSLFSNYLHLFAWFRPMCYKNSFLPPQPPTTYLQRRPLRYYSIANLNGNNSFVLFSKFLQRLWGGTTVQQSYNTLLSGGN